MVKSFCFTLYHSAGTSVSYSVRSPSEQNKQQTHFRNVLDAYRERNVSLLIWVSGHGLSFHTDLHSSHLQSQWDSSLCSCCLTVSVRQHCQRSELLHNLSHVLPNNVSMWGSKALCKPSLNLYWMSLKNK